MTGLLQSLGRILRPTPWPQEASCLFRAQLQVQYVLDRSLAGNPRPAKPRAASAKALGWGYGHAGGAWGAPDGGRMSHRPVGARLGSSASRAGRVLGLGRLALGLARAALAGCSV